MGLKFQVTSAITQAFQRAGLSLTWQTTLPKANVESLLVVLQRKGFRAGHILDVGANRASWSKEASPYYPRARYTLVEPQEHLASFIEPFCAEHPGAEWIRAAMGAREEQREFVMAADTVSSSFFIAPALRTDEHQVRTVPVRTLDGVCAERGIPDILKIDAEGAEREILEAGTTLLGKTELILLELPFFRFHPDQPVFSEMVAHMAEAGYEPFHFTWFGPRPHDGAQGLCELAFARRDGELRSHHGWW